MSTTPRILVLGAYGLAGRAIVGRFVEKSAFSVIAAGRRPGPLEACAEAWPRDRVRLQCLDATDALALWAACGEADFVVNAVGPYARHGEDIARTVLACHRPYLDCANEQTHYRRLQHLDGEARAEGVPVITAAGAIPGLSTLFAAHLLAQGSTPVSAEIHWAQFRHAYPDAGHASVMSGILEALHRPVTLAQGDYCPVTLGRSVKTADLPSPYGMRPLLEVPCIDTLTLPERFPVDDLHTWFFLGDLPLGLLHAIRLLRPHRCGFTYRLIDAAVRRVDGHAFQQALQAGLGPEALLDVVVRDRDGEQHAHLIFRDGAVATAVLPVRMIRDHFAGKACPGGLWTPLDRLSYAELDAEIAEVTVPSTRL